MGAATEHVLVYDGSCGLCRAAVAWIRCRHPREPIRPVDYHDPAALGPLPVTFQEADRSVFLISPGRGRWKGYRAVVEVLALLPAFAPWAPLFRSLPLRLLGAVGYRLVSGNRHGISRLLGLEGGRKIWPCRGRE